MGRNRLIGISRLLHRLAWERNRLPGLLRLLGLIGIRLLWRRLIPARVVADSTTGSTTTGSTASNDPVARPSCSHIQWIGRLCVRIVGIIRIIRIHRLCGSAGLGRALGCIRSTASAAAKTPAGAAAKTAAGAAAGAAARRCSERRNQRIGKLSRRADVQQTEILARQWVLVAMAQESNIARGLQIIERLRVGLKFPVEKLDGPLILQPSIDGHLLFGALRFKGNTRHFHVKRDRDSRSHHEHQQQREARFLALAGLPPDPRFIQLTPLPAAAFAGCCS